MRDDACLQVVADSAARNSAEECVHVDMAAQPAALLAVQARFDVGILAVRQSRHEQVDFRDFAGHAVHDLHGLAAPVHFARLAGLVLQVVREAAFGDVGLVAEAELRVAAGELPCGLAGLLMLLPEQLQGHADTLELLVDIRIVRLLVEHLGCELPRVEAAVYLVVREAFDVLERYARFCSEAQHLVDRALRDVVAARDGVLRQALRSQLQDELGSDFPWHKKCLLSADSRVKSRPQFTEKRRGFQA